MLQAAICKTALLGLGPEQGSCMCWVRSAVPRTVLYCCQMLQHVCRAAGMVTCAVSECIRVQCAAICHLCTCACCNREPSCCAVYHGVLGLCRAWCCHTFACCKLAEQQEHAYSLIYVQPRHHSKYTSGESLSQTIQQKRGSQLLSTQQPTTYTYLQSLSLCAAEKRSCCIYSSSGSSSIYIWQRSKKRKGKWT